VSMGEIFETPALAVRSLVVAISGAEVCSELAKYKAGGPRMHRGPFVPFGSWRSWEMGRLMRKGTLTKRPRFKRNRLQDGKREGATESMTPRSRNRGRGREEIEFAALRKH